MTKKNRINWLVGLSSVFSNRRYVYLSILTSAFFWVIIAILTQYSWLKFVLTSSLVGVSTKISLFVSVLSGNLVNYSIFSYVIYIIMSLLVGINISVLVFNIKNYRNIHKSAGLGAGALVLGILGIGCASCGSFLLASILGTTTVLSIVYFLPLKGLEINLLALLFLLFSIYLSARHINRQHICKYNK